MSLSVTLVAVAIGLLLIAQVIVAMKKRKISEYQGIPWMLAGIILIILGLCPNLIHAAADFFDVVWPPAVLLFAIVVIFGFILFSHSKEMSAMKAQIMELSMQISVLKEQLREEKKENGDTKENK